MIIPNLQNLQNYKWYPYLLILPPHFPTSRMHPTYIIKLCARAWVIHPRSCFSLMTQIGYVVHFNIDLYRKKSTFLLVFSWWHCNFHISIRVSFWLVLSYIDTHEICMNNFTKYISWYSFTSFYKWHHRLMSFFCGILVHRPPPPLPSCTLIYHKLSYNTSLEVNMVIV